MIIQFAFSNRVLEKGNNIRQMSSTSYESRSMPSQLTGQLHIKVKKFEAELAMTQTEYNKMQAVHDMMITKWARRDSFEPSTLLLVFRLKEIDLFNMHVAILTWSVPRARSTRMINIKTFPCFVLLKSGKFMNGITLQFILPIN